MPLTRQEHETSDIAANLRKTPRTDGEILAVVPRGTTVGVGACRDGWCRVSWNGQDGYAIGRNLGIAAAPRWPNVPVTAGPGDHASLQKTANTAREHEEHEHDDSSPEHSFILEIGTAGEWPLNGEHPNFGGTIAAEIEPIENWLELEFGLSTLATGGHTELSGDLLFKKPFRLSPTVEFMVGAGPSFSRILNGPERGRRAECGIRARLDVLANQKYRLVHRTNLEREPKKWATVRCGQHRRTYRVPQMSTASPSSATENRRAMIKQAFWLEYMTLAWMILEAAVAIGSGITAGRLTLTAFGIDSLIELSSACVLVSGG